MKKGVVRLPNEKRGCTASQWKRGRTASQWKKGLYGFPMALIRDVTAKEREIHSSIIVLLDVRKEATMCIIPVIPISKFTRILTSTGKLFAGEGSLQNNFSNRKVVSKLKEATLLFLILQKSRNVFYLSRYLKITCNIVQFWIRDLPFRLGEFT